MELALPERFDTRQALRYLGISTEEPDSATRALLRRAERTLRAAAGPRAVAVRAARDDISPYLQGNDILRHLEGCGSCVLLACTLGARVDAALRAAGASDMAYAVVLDALASVAVEQTADAAEQTLRNEEREEGRLSHRRAERSAAFAGCTAKNRPVRHSGASADAAQERYGCFGRGRSSGDGPSCGLRKLCAA
jgi:hypothetical protein